MNCFGKERRKEIVSKYNIEPIAYLKLLNDELESCTGKKITEAYYTFYYQHKVNNNDKGTFISGKTSGKHFLELINHTGLSLFNPLQEIATTNGPESAGTSSGETSKVKWDPMALELFNAINILIFYWGNRPLTNFLAEFLIDIRKYPYAQPYDKRIKAVNTVISRQNHNTIQGMLSELRNTNPSIKEFSFDTLHKYLLSKDLDSYFK
ncbi:MULTISPECIES: hypothetical protein [Metabacillus]|uniref:hypothetical protein n=1 Tax=Metabacillus TaxID=2675233 RepID=UPI000C7FF362|nr:MULTISPECIES: hypothetical protein [Metabacillus]MCM3443270.1 hypothetical protein [Metabacillus halosaccharovorans]PMC34216.1 hypothetical protein CJ195_24160 [Bacillus sp. UMB0899]